MKLVRKLNRSLEEKEKKQREVENDEEVFDYFNYSNYSNYSNYLNYLGKPFKKNALADIPFFRRNGVMDPDYFFDIMSHRYRHQYYYKTRWGDW